MASLLGQYYFRINGSQEDIASEGLAYILNSSLFARNTLCNFISNCIGIDYENINYLTQNIGKNQERPDISGIDKYGIEKIIIEAKFWASLTENQPNEYLNRLNEESTLIFICPKLREASLINEIETRISHVDQKYSIKNNIFELDNQKYIIITSWNEILILLKDKLIENNERILVSDIDQLIGFCEIIDNYSFLPIKDADLSPSIAKRINSYCDILDKITDKLRIELKANTTGLKATGQKFGYTRYIKINNYGFAIEVNMKMWELNMDTPFWIVIRDKSWKQPKELSNRLKEVSTKLKIRNFRHYNNNDLYFAIIPRINTVEEEIIDDIIILIKNILLELN